MKRKSFSQYIYKSGMFIEKKTPNSINKPPPPLPPGMEWINPGSTMSGLPSSI